MCIYSTTGGMTYLTVRGVYIIGNACCRSAAFAVHHTLPAECVGSGGARITSMASTTGIHHIVHGHYSYLHDSSHPCITGIHHVVHV